MVRRVNIEVVIFEVPVIGSVTLSIQLAIQLEQMGLFMKDSTFAIIFELAELARVINRTLDDVIARAIQ